MGRLRRWRRRCEALWRSSQIHDEIAEELQFHVDLRTDANIRSGMAPATARHEALRRFGPLRQIEEQGYDVRGAGRRDALIADLTYAIRLLVRHKGFSVIAVLTLAVGIGANVAILTVVNAVLLRPLPFREPDRVVRVFDDLSGAGAYNVGISVPELEDLRDRSDVFQQVCAIYPASTALSGGDHVERIELLGTAPSYFELLGATAALGRVYGQAEWMPGFLDGVVISDGLWKRQFGSDPRTIGRRIRLDEDGYTIIGVMPADFRHPGQTLNGEVDVWSAAGFIAPPFPTPNRSVRLIPGVIGRLKAGLTLPQAQHRLDALAARLQQTYPTDYPPQVRWSLRVEPAQTSLTGPVRPTLVVLLAAVCFVLVLVCVNIATLLIARSAARLREFALLQALGASRGRVARQVLTESLLLSLLGGVAAIVALRFALTPLLAMMPADVRRLAEVHAGWRMVALALGLSVVAGVMCGLVPALRAAAIDPNRDLQEGGRTGGAQSPRHSRSRAALVVVEIALSVMLLIGAGLLLRSFSAMLLQEPGLDPRGLTTGQVWIPVPNNPRANRYLTLGRRAGLARELLRHLVALPGVQKAALGRANDVPFLNHLRNPLPFSFPDEATTSRNDHAAEFGTVSPDYFDVLKTPLRNGRVFTDHDAETARGVVVVNDAFARAFSPVKDPVGRSVRDGAGVESEIIGVVGDVRDEGLDVPPQPRVYASIFQNSSFALAVFLRTQSDTRTVQAALTRTIHGVDPELPVFGVRTMDELMSASMARQRFSLFLMSLFAAVALLLAALGVYGVMAFVVGQRLQEFGIRRALGAQSRDIFALAFRPGVPPISAGVLIGLAGSVGASRLMSSVLFGVSAGDPVTFATVPLLLGFVAVMACVIPARRATRMSPVEALRS
jgi:predicted permease